MQGPTPLGLAMWGGARAGVAVHPVVELLTTTITATTAVRSYSALANCPASTRTDCTGTVRLAGGDISASGFGVCSLSVVRKRALSSGLFLIAIGLIGGSSRTFDRDCCVGNLRPASLHSMRDAFRTPRCRAAINVSLSGLSPTQVTTRVTRTGAVLPRKRSCGSMNHCRVRRRIPTNGSTFGHGHGPNRRRASFVIHFARSNGRARDDTNGASCVCCRTGIAIKPSNALAVRRG